MMYRKDYRKIENTFMEATSWGVENTNEASLSDYGDIEMFDKELDFLLSEEYRSPVSTGVDFIDHVTKGGLGKGQFGVIIAEKGLGKTTILTKFANEAYMQGLNVLHLFFEDMKSEILRKHFSLFSGVSLDKLNEQRAFVKEKIVETIDSRPNKLFVQRMEQKRTTISYIKSFIRQLEAAHECKIDVIVLDYIDCVGSGTHFSQKDTTASQEEVVRQFEALTNTENVVGWTAVQANRSAFGESKITAKNMGGSVSRALVGHFVATFGKNDQKANKNLATCYIEKCRFGLDHITFDDIYFNNSNLTIKEDPPQSYYREQSYIPEPNDIDNDEPFLEGVKSENEEEIPPPTSPFPDEEEEENQHINLLEDIKRKIN